MSLISRIELQKAIFNRKSLIDDLPNNTRFISLFIATVSFRNNDMKFIYCYFHE